MHLYLILILLVPAFIFSVISVWNSLTRKKALTLDLTDPDSWIRRETLWQLAPTEIPDMMMGDPDWRVRIEVAKRVDLRRLHKMMKDKDWGVRRMVARRIDPSRLHEMVGDPNVEVRWEVAMRIPCRHLTNMLMREADQVTRLILQGRISRVIVANRS